RWHSRESNRDNNEALATGLFHWPYFGTSSRASDSAMESVCRHDRNSRAWFADVAQCLLGAFGALVVWPDRSGYAFCGNNGNALVGGHRDRDRRAPRSADLSSRRFDDGIKAIPHLVQGNPSCRATFHRKRNEARVGFRLAFPDGRRNLRDNSDRLRAWTASALRP